MTSYPKLRQRLRHHGRAAQQILINRHMSKVGQIKVAIDQGKWVCQNIFLDLEKEAEFTGMVDTG